MRASTARAGALGLRCRPVRDTIRATLDWHRARTESATSGRSLTRERERAILDAWRAKQAQSA